MDRVLFRSRLLAWYDAGHRDLPWRRTRDPYRIWVSEVMLQQTQVDTVIPYYERFLDRFPTVAALAAASDEDVLKVWEGLGYYARARHLHTAARSVAAAGGTFPDRFEALAALPGVGRSTAGAVASIAAGAPHPVLDGNVRRVLCRLFAVGRDPRTPPVERRLWRLAALLLDPERPGDYNQALMELGATVCTPRGPRCGDCPVAALCRARARGLAEDLPIHSRRPPLPHHEVAVGVIRRDDGAVLIARRPAEGLLGGLWEFPGGKREEGESLEDCLRREVREELGIEVEVGERFATVRHAYTHFKVTLHAFHCRHRSGEPRALGCTAWRWVAPAELDAYPMPAANRKLLESLGDNASYRRRS